MAPHTHIPSFIMRIFNAENITRCTELCRKTKALDCQNHAICEPTCEEAFGMSECSQQLGAFLSCSMDATLTAFECSDEGTPSLKSGECEAQQKNVAACLEGTFKRR